MFLPLSTEHQAKTKPIANLTLIALTAVTSVSLFSQLASDAPLPTFVLSRADFRPEQLLGHLLTHADFEHLFGNMLLLLVIGNPVNRRLGNLRYTGLYLLMGIVAGLAWLGFGAGVGAIGASGAVMGMVGVFLILFPTNRIMGVLSWLALGLLALLLLWWATGMPLDISFVMAALALYAGGAFFFISRSLSYSSFSLGNALLTLLGLRVVHMTGIWLVLLTLGFDVAYLLSGISDGVAHVAHVGGALTGFALGAALCLHGSVRGTTSEPTLVELAGLVEPRTVPGAVRSACVVPARRTRGYGHRQPMTFERWLVEKQRTERVRGTTRRSRRPAA